MSSNYPYISDRICKECGGSITIKQKRDQDNEYCSRDCYNKFRRVTRPIKINLKSGNICLRCKKTFVPTRNTLGMYCSYTCSNGAKSVSYKINCKCCSKEFIVKNIAEIKRGHYKYCSNECRKRKYSINEGFFDNINSETCYWMGVVWSIIKSNKYNKIYLLSSKKEILEGFNDALNSNYPIKNSRDSKYILRITSLKIIETLSKYGIRSDLYQEFPEIPKKYFKDFIRGYFDTENGFIFKDNGKTVVSLRGKSSKLMRYISEFLNCKIVPDKGEWVLVSFNFKDRVDGLPRLESKWEKI